MYETQFSNNSYGFRPRRGAHDAIRKCQQYADEGYKYAVDMDLAKYFDTVNQSKLIEVLSKSIKDGRVISLIHKYLKAGVIIQHKYENTLKGVPQGGPLSPLLSNIMLNELDKELKKRGHRFVRYADDMVILCKSKRSAERTLENLLPFIERKLYLKVNQEKTSVNYIGRIKFLGFKFYQYKSTTRICIQQKSIQKMKEKVKELTKRNRGCSNKNRPLKLKEYIRGWVNYFKIADMKRLLKDVDEWMRRRIRAIYWNQWKKIKTRHKMLKHFGISERKAWEFSNTRKSYWRISNSPIMSRTLNNQRIKDLGYIYFSEYYKQVSVN